MDNKQATQFIEEAKYIIEKDALVRLELECMSATNIRIEWMRGGGTIALARGYNDIKLSKIWWEHLTEKQRRAAVIHEVCHLADFYLWYTTNNNSTLDHGTCWQNLMIKAGEPPLTKFPGPTPKAVLEKIKPCVAHCKQCKFEWHLSKNKYTRMAKKVAAGTYFFCPTCNRAINF